MMNFSWFWPVNFLPDLAQYVSPGTLRTDILCRIKITCQPFFSLANRNNYPYLYHVHVAILWYILCCDVNLWIESRKWNNTLCSNDFDLKETDNSLRDGKCWPVDCYTSLQKWVGSGGLVKGRRKHCASALLPVYHRKSRCRWTYPWLWPEPVCRDFQSTDWS